MKLIGFFALAYATIIPALMGYYLLAIKAGVYWWVYIDRTTRWADHEREGGG